MVILLKLYAWEAEKTKRYLGKAYTLNGPSNFHHGKGRSWKTKKQQGIHEGPKDCVPWVVN